VAGLAAAFGSGAMTNSFVELEDAKCIFIIGSNTSVGHPLVATRIYRARAQGAKIIVADPREIQMARFADIYVRQRLGSDVALLNGMMNAIYKNGWHNQAFVEERTENFEAFVDMIEKFPPERAAEITGISADSIIRMAEYYAKASASSIVYCMGITQHTTGVDNVKTLANLAMLCGQIGRPSTGVNPLRGQNNVQGACDMGGLPNVYPAYQAVTVPDNQQKFEKLWNAPMSPAVGLTIMEMMDGLENGKIKALIIMGENPVISDPDSNHVKHALQAAELLVTIDIFPTPTTELAHVVFPGACFAEKDGTFSNSERRVQLVRKAIEPPGEARADWAIFQDLANRMGYSMSYQSAEEVFAEIRQTTPSYAGMTYSRLEGDGLCWPCPTEEHPGTQYLHKDRFSRGRGLFHAIDYRPPAEEPDDEYPFWLTTGRSYVHYHTGTMTRVSAHLQREMPEVIMEIHPDDARDFDLRDGALARISSRRGTIVSKVRLTDRIGKGVLFLPFHFAENAANVLTNTALDPIAKIPEYKVCAVKLEKAA
jgi:formate dehydrogenase major subunit